MSDEQEFVEPSLISRAESLHQEGRIIRLEEFRSNHEKEHEKHVATKAWVYTTALSICVGIASVTATVMFAILRSI